MTTNTTSELRQIKGILAKILDRLTTEDYRAEFIKPIPARDRTLGEVWPEHALSSRPLSISEEAWDIACAKWWRMAKNIIYHIERNHQSIAISLARKLKEELEHGQADRMGGTGPDCGPDPQQRVNRDCEPTRASAAGEGSGRYPWDEREDYPK